MLYFHHESPWSNTLIIAIKYWVENLLEKRNDYPIFSIVDRFRLFWARCRLLQVVSGCLRSSLILVSIWTSGVILVFIVFWAFDQILTPSLILSIWPLSQLLMKRFHLKTISKFLLKVENRQVGTRVVAFLKNSKSSVLESIQ